MKGRIYLRQDSDVPFLKDLAAAFAPKAGVDAAIPVRRRGDREELLIRWSSQLRVPWIQPGTEEVDGVCRFFRTVPEQLIGVDGGVFAELKDTLLVAPLAFDGCEGVYGDDVTRARVTGDIHYDMNVVRVEVAGNSASRVIDLYALLRSGEAPRISGWHDRWHDYDLEFMHWQLPATAQVR